MHEGNSLLCELLVSTSIPFFRRCHSLGVYSTEYPEVATEGSDLTCLPEEGAYRVREEIWIYFICFVELSECLLGFHQEAYQKYYPTR
jgi:hypothetical protein